MGSQTLTRVPQVLETSLKPTSRQPPLTARGLPSAAGRGPIRCARVRRTGRSEHFFPPRSPSLSRCMRLVCFRSDTEDPPTNISRLPSPDRRVTRGVTARTRSACTARRQIRTCRSRFGSPHGPSLLLSHASVCPCHRTFRCEVAWDGRSQRMSATIKRRGSLLAGGDVLALSPLARCVREAAGSWGVWARSLAASGCLGATEGARHSLRSRSAAACWPAAACWRRGHSCPRAAIGSRMLAIHLEGDAGVF